MACKLLLCLALLGMSLSGALASGSDCGVDTYTNVTMDVAAMQGDANAGKWADYSDIYLNGRFASRYDPATCAKQAAKRIPAGVAGKKYCTDGTAPQNCEPFFHLAASYYGTLQLPDGSPDQYLAAAWSPAINGTGAYASACCGVRAEAAKALATVYLMVYTLHEVDAGIKAARYTGAWTKKEEVVDGLAIFQGAARREALSTLADTTAAALCLRRDAAGWAAVKAAGDAMVAAYDAQNAFALEVAYARFYKLSMALMMRLTLLASKEASAYRPATNGRTACYRQCPGAAQLAAARSYYLLVAPEGGRSAPAANAALLAAISPRASPQRAYSAVRAHLKAVATEAGIDYASLVQRC